MLRIAATVSVAVLFSGCGVGSSSKDAVPEAATAIPRGACGAGSVPEDDLQGRVPSTLRQAGFPGYSCNLELIGQWQGEGASYQHASYGDCSYYGTKNDPSQENPGSVVVDVSDPLHPVATTYLTDDALVDPWESIKTHVGRGLLAGVRGDNGGEQGTGGPEFSVYDVKADCRQPVLLASTTFEGVVGHEGNFNQDGTLYYGSGGGSLATGGSKAYGIDITDPATPKLLGTFQPSGHGLSFSPDGTRGYAVLTGTSINGNGDNGLFIVDTSEFQQRKANPQVTVLGSVTWADGRIAQHTVPVTYDGKPYVVFSDEGLYGAARIIDVSNEAAPVVVSTLKLEIHQPENRAIAESDGAVGLLNYDGHYCSVDRLENPTVAACGYNWSGIRVFDIRDPLAPKEIAYYVPSGLTAPGAGSQAAGETPEPAGIDLCTAHVRFVPERGELWSTCHANGFLVLKFTNGAWPFKD